MNDFKNDQYNYGVANSYDNTLELPFRKYVELPTTYSLIGKVKDLKVLDLACGTGHYTRYLSYEKAEVIGIDISEEMLNIAMNIAMNIEKQQPLGIRYYLHDVLELQKIGNFDLITAIYLFHYFSTKNQLIKVCKNIFSNLKNGGRFLTYVLNPDFKNRQGYYKKYGFDICEIEKLTDGCTSSFLLNGIDKIIVSYFWSKYSLEDALSKAGFKQIKWIEPTVSEAGIKKFGKAFWKDYLEHPRLIHLEAFKVQE